MARTFTLCFVVAAIAPLTEAYRVAPRRPGNLKAQHRRGNVSAPEDEAEASLTREESRGEVLSVPSVDTVLVQDSSAQEKLPVHYPELLEDHTVLKLESTFGSWVEMVELKLNGWSWFVMGFVPITTVVLFVWLALRPGLGEDPLSKPRKPGMVNTNEEDPKIVPIILSIISISIPNLLGGVLALLNEITSTIFVGQAGTRAQLAAVGLGNMMQTIVAVSIGFGITGALDTLVSQARGGGRQVLACYHLQRCRVLTTLQLIWMLPIMYHAESILLWAGQDPEISANAGAYCRVTCIGIFFMFQTSATTTFLRNQGDVVVPVLVSIVGCVLHVILCAVFVLKFNMGNFGIACANVFGNITSFAATSVYLVCFSEASGLGTTSLLWVEGPGLRDLTGYMRLALPTTLTTCTEWWFWEVNAFFAGLLGQVSMASHVAVGNFNAVCFMPAMGLGASSASLVGNATGANLPRKAKLTAFLCVGVNLSLWMLLAGAVVKHRGTISRIYSTDPEVQRVIEELLIIFALSGFGDTTQAVIGGALRGLGKQMTAAVIYVMTYYGIVLPLGLWLAFGWGMGIFGIWWSFVFGTGLAALVLVVLLFRTDFHETAAESAARLAAMKKLSSPTTGVWRRPTSKKQMTATMTAQLSMTSAQNGSSSSDTTIGGTNSMSSESSSSANFVR